ncbi:hypothetical protein EV182_000771 [Spiromyces aspiralis]|uniref:Uncharacterized protein n=1 Tax=Spiromyces aspiralis TaxID=68401 RepID=A0ACC1HTY5_9FUNG|nr:hypothetical protein EV182_000771 [Spiromyces aspiralis]
MAVLVSNEDGAHPPSSSVPTSPFYAQTKLLCKLLAPRNSWTVSLTIANVGSQDVMVKDIRLLDAGSSLSSPSQLSSNYTVISSSLTSGEDRCTLPHTMPLGTTFTVVYMLQLLNPGERRGHIRGNEGGLVSPNPSHSHPPITTTAAADPEMVDIGPVEISWHPHDRPQEAVSSVVVPPVSSHPLRPHGVIVESVFPPITTVRSPFRLQYYLTNNTRASISLRVTVQAATAIAFAGPKSVIMNLLPRSSQTLSLICVAFSAHGGDSPATAMTTSSGDNCVGSIQVPGLEIHPLLRPGDDGDSEAAGEGEYNQLDEELSDDDDDSEQDRLARPNCALKIHMLAKRYIYVHPVASCAAPTTLPS